MCAIFSTANLPITQNLGSTQKNAMDLTQIVYFKSHIKYLHTQSIYNGGYKLGSESTTRINYNYKHCNSFLRSCR